MNKILEKIRSRGKWRIFFGLFFVVFGLLIHLIPFVPGSWAIALGLELLGIRLLIQDKLKGMNRIYSLLLAILILAISVAAAFYFLPEQESIQNIQTTQLSVYKNSEYGFEISYPSNLTATTTFQRYYALGNSWRADALLDDNGESKGKNVVSIPVYRIDNHTGGAYVSYPLYYDAEVRVGVSSDPKDVETCLLSTNETLGAPEIINGVNFSKFIIQDAAMMQYIGGVSYRVIHNNTCFAIEQLKAGSNYRDMPNPKDIPDSVLDSYYNQIPDIIKTFKFL